MTTPAMDRPSWAVMAPAAISSHFPVAAHSVFWTWEADRYRCVGCKLVRTLEEFETKPECVT